MAKRNPWASLANPLGALTRPVAKPRLPADKRKGYRPKISQPKPRRTPPRAPTRAPKRTTVSRDPFARSPLATLTRPIKQSGSFEAQHLRALARTYRADMLRQIHAASRTSGARGGQTAPSPGSIKFSSDLKTGKPIRALGAPGSTIDQLAADLAYLRKSPHQQQAIVARKLGHKIHEIHATSNAPALWALEKIGRPGRAVEGGIVAAITHKDVGQALKAGITGKAHLSGSDIWKAIGWHPHGTLGKLAQAGVGLATDVALDPTTYVTGGLSSVARNAAMKAASTAAEQAAAKEAERVLAQKLAAGASRSEAKTAARNAAKQTHAKTYENVFNRTLKDSTQSRTRAPEIKIAGRRIGGRHQIKATSLPQRAASRAAARAEAVPKLGPKLAGARLVTRDALSKANAQIRPVGMTAEEHRLGRQIKRERRAQTATGAARASARASTIAKVVAPDEQRKFGSALEAGQHDLLKGAPEIKLGRRARRGATQQALSRLTGSDRLQHTADRYRADVDQMHQDLKTAGVPIGDIKRIAPPKKLTRQAQKLSDQLDGYRTRAAKASAKARKTSDPGLKAKLRTRAQGLGREAAKTQTKLADVNAQIKAEMDRLPDAYKPRVLKSTVEQRGGPTSLEDLIGQPVRHGGGPKRIPGQAKPRTVRAALDVLRGGTPEERRHAAKFTEDPSLEYQTYMTAGHRSLAQAESEAKLFAAGRPVTKGEAIHLGEGEKVYARKPGEAKVTEAKYEHGDVIKPSDPHEHVVLSKAFHDFVQAPEAEISNRWTRFMGGWKSWALKTPSYLMRNATGDLFNAMGAQRADRLAVNWLRGQRTLSAREKAAKGYQWFEDAAAKHTGRKTITLNGREFTYDQLAMLAEATGAINAGRLAEAAKLADRKLRPKGTQLWQATSDRVENSARIGTFIGALERGKTPEEAADLVRDIHFDYGELTAAEKSIRAKGLPFYTFSARNVPLQARLLATRPGLAASYESARTEGIKESGVPRDFYKGLDPYEASQLSIPLKFGDHVYTVSTGSPITDLNVLTPANPSDPASWAKQLVVGPGTRGLQLLGPAKVVGELLTNHSLFYGESIKPDPRSGQANMTPVNPIVAQMADALGPGFRKKFGIEKQLDKTSGKQVWSWGKEKEYALTSALPGPFGAAYRAARTSAGPRGFSPTTEALGSLAGVRAKPFDKIQAESTRLNTELNTLLARVNIIHGSGHNLTYKPTPELLRLEKRRRQIETRLDQIGRQTKAWYKGAPNVRQPRTSGLGGSAGLGGGGGLGGGSSLGGGTGLSG